MKVPSDKSLAIRKRLIEAQIAKQTSLGDWYLEQGNTVDAAYHHAKARAMATELEAK